ncbi:succinate dehydrogenase cytochrome b subunit [Flavisolibacter tropicus]|uniref:Succinate dehydrogenase n=1 Tax=Flavisolibacter tropicus TaxID=1492898 RepID=A0A172TQ36_9BACT|nr:succinate dehydrogenase cytochrome b subunit [Flavisolibacter tropicus]ANE49140.1 succinate dehydrogenase [Flavisolibacter tropicus]
MKWSYFFTSAVGRKLVMALTGLFLISFLLVHVGLNSCIFNDLAIFDPTDNGSMFNRAANFMGASLVIRIMEIGLFGFLILHVVQGYAVEAKNKSRRTHGYEKGLGNRGSKWYSRSMALLGTLILLFLIMHISHFWVPSRVTHNLESVVYKNGAVETHNLFLRMYEVFQNPFIVILYLAGVISLAYHLFHGFQSAFRTIGVHNKKYLVLLQSLGYGFTIIVCILFALMPISMYMNWVSPN